MVHLEALDENLYSEDSAAVKFVERLYAIRDEIDASFKELPDEIKSNAKATHSLKDAEEALKRLSGSIAWLHAAGQMKKDKEDNK